MRRLILTLSLLPSLAVRCSTSCGTFAPSPPGRSEVENAQPAPEPVTA